MICKNRKEFYELGGFTKANMATYVKRGVVVAEPDGTFDTENPTNKYFLDNRKSKGLAPGSVKTVQPKSTAPAEPKLETIPLTPKAKKAANNAFTDKLELEVKKLRAELDKKYVDTDLARQKLATVMGGNIPVDLVKEIVAQLSKSLLNNYKSYSDQLITQLCHENRVLDADRAKMLSRNLTGLNTIHSKAVDDAKMQMKNATKKTRNNIALENEEDG